MPSSIRPLPALVAALATLAFLTGCATPVTVTSDPPGAAVYARGSGRPAYRWECKGNTPVTFGMPHNAILTFVSWPDGTRSETRRTELLFVDKAEEHFARPAAAKPTASSAAK